MARDCFSSKILTRPVNVYKTEKYFNEKEQEVPAPEVNDQGDFPLNITKTDFSIDVVCSDYLTGGANNWFYGIWQNQEADLSFKNLERFYEAASEKDKIKNTKADAAAFEDQGSKYVYYSLPAENKIENGKWLTHCKYYLNLEKALTGAVFTDQENNSYMPFILGNILHSERAGGNTFYEIEGIKIRNGSADENKFKLQWIRGFYIVGNTELGCSIF